MKRNRYSKALKARLRLEPIKGQKTAREQARRETERDQLYRQTGKLLVEVDWLKNGPDI